jgi:hypothetical protein
VRSVGERLRARTRYTFLKILSVLGRKAPNFSHRRILLTSESCWPMLCSQCGKPMEAARATKRYCSDACKQAAYRNAKRGILSGEDELAALLAAMPACCADAKRASNRRRTCDQHQQWRKFLRTARRRGNTLGARDVAGVALPGPKHDANAEAFASLSQGGVDYRVSADPDSFLAKDKDDYAQDRALENLENTNAELPCHASQESEN